VTVLLLVIVLSLFRKTMGFNPGEAPYKWMKDILATPFVDALTTEKLMNKKIKEPKPTTLDENGKRVELSRDPRLVFITANLTHNRIVKFPENSSDYWAKYSQQVCPAAYVRASMSLPFIFHAFVTDDKYVIGPNDQPVSNTVALSARFVDGGLLSNFPIREFHVPPPQIPSYPTFGVLLGSPKAEPQQDSASLKKKFESLSVFKFILSFISTFRNFYDYEFLQTHKEFKQLVNAVNTDQFNSLDFGMPFATKQAIFSAGAATAIKQLESFSWKEYLIVRTESIPVPKTQNGNITIRSN